MANVPLSSGFSANANSPSWARAADFNVDYKVLARSMAFVSVVGGGTPQDSAGTAYKSILTAEEVVVYAGVLQRDLNVGDIVSVPGSPWGIGFGSFAPQSAYAFVDPLLTEWDSAKFVGGSTYQTITPPGTLYPLKMVTPAISIDNEVVLGLHVERIAEKNNPSFPDTMNNLPFGYIEGVNDQGPFVFNFAFGSGLPGGGGGEVNGPPAFGLPRIMWNLQLSNDVISQSGAGVKSHPQAGYGYRNNLGRGTTLDSHEMIYTVVKYPSLVMSSPAPEPVSTPLLKGGSGLAYLTFGRQLSLAYAQVNAAGNSELRFKRCDTDVLPFTVDIVVDTANPNEEWGEAHVLEDAEGAYWLMAAYRGATVTVWIFRSVDKGKTWGEKTVVFTNAKHNAQCYDRLNHAHYGAALAVVDGHLIVTRREWGKTTFDTSWAPTEWIPGPNIYIPVIVKDDSIGLAMSETDDHMIVLCGYRSGSTALTFWASNDGARTFRDMGS